MQNAQQPTGGISALRLQHNTSSRQDRIWEIISAKHFARSRRKIACSFLGYRQHYRLYLGHSMFVSNSRSLLRTHCSNSRALPNFRPFTKLLTQFGLRAFRQGNIERVDGQRNQRVVTQDSYQVDHSRFAQRRHRAGVERVVQLAVL